jgi:hypothetical protein
MTAHKPEAAPLPLALTGYHTGIRQVVRGGGTAVLTAEDVVNLVREAGVVFMDEAILATLTRPLGHLGSPFLVDITSHERGFGGPEPWPFLGCVLNP